MVLEKVNYINEAVVDAVDSSLLCLESSEQNGKKYYYLSGIFQRGNVPNINRRIYPTEVLNTNVRELQEEIQSKSVVVELDHPSDSGSSYQHSIGVITELKECDTEGAVWGKIQLSDPGMNDDVKRLVGLMEIGHKPGISSRGHSRSQTEPCVERRAGSDGNLYDYITPQFKLKTFDVVVYPSVSSARAVGCLEDINQLKVGIQIMNRDERIAAIRKLFQESTFDDIWGIFQETGFSDVMSKVAEAVLKERKSDIDKIVADQVGEKLKAQEAVQQAKIKAEAEKMANEALEAEGSIVIDFLSFCKAVGLVDESGKVPDEVWSEATAQWGASIDNDLFAGKKRVDASMRTKIIPAGSVHKESGVATPTEQLADLIKKTVNDAINSHPGLRETEFERARKRVRESADRAVTAGSAYRQIIVDSIVSMFDAGQSFTEDQIVSTVKTQERLFEASAKLGSSTNVAAVPGQIGVTGDSDKIGKQQQVSESIAQGVKAIFE